MRAQLRKHTLFLREGDWDYLESIYKTQGLNTSVIVRTLVSNHVDKLRSREDQPIPSVDVNL